MIELAIGGLTGVFIIATGLAVSQQLEGRRQARLARDRASAAEATVAGVQLAGVPTGESPVLKLGRKLSKDQTDKSLRARLAAAGFHAESAASTFLGYKVLLALLGGLGSAALFLPLGLPAGVGLFVAAMATGTLYLVPDLIVWRARQTRRAEVQRHLPDAIDLLEICVSSGMGLDMAWNAVADEMRSVNTTLADEMDLTNLELSLGVGRAVAMRHMAERTGADEISSLVALLVQADRFGASVVDALRTFAETMRETRSARAEEAAEKMAVKMLFPMVLFIFPPLLIVMVGPAMVKLVQTISG